MYQLHLKIFEKHINHQLITYIIITFKFYIRIFIMI